MIMVKSYLYIASYIVCIFPIITLIFSLKYTNTPYLTGFLSELSNSLNDLPLSDLEYSKYCSDEKFLLSIYTVPGTVSGCSCVNVSNYIYKQGNKHLVFKGKCKTNNTLNGCISISNYSSVNLNKWHSKVFCSKKYTSSNGYKKYFKNSVGKDEKCENGYKNCGKLDDMGNYLCLPKNESCPVNDIQILNEKNDNLTDYEFYKIGNKYLYFTNKSIDKPIITKLKAAEGKLCNSRGYYHTYYPQFILDENFEKYGCRYKIMESMFDESISKLDSITKNELYLDNNLSMYSRYNDSCDYPYYSLNAEIFLYSKRYIGFNKKCLKENNLNIDNAIFKQENIDLINNSLLKNREEHKILIWISIAAIDFYFMTCFFINIDEENNLLNFYIWSAITIPFYLSMNIVSIIGLTAIANIKKYPLCNDSITNGKIELYNTKSKNMLLNTLTLVIIINGQLILTIILFLIKRRKILRNKNNIIDNMKSSNFLSSINKTSQEIPIITETQKQDSD